MQREFFEETGVVEAQWDYVAQLSNTGVENPFVVSVFRCQSIRCSEVRTMTDEVVSIWSVQNVLQAPTELFLPNMSWLFRLVLDLNVKSSTIHY